MGKMNLIRTTLLISLLFALALNNTLAQAETYIEQDSLFTWKLRETSNPSAQTVFQFIPSEDITVVSWNFGDGGSSSEASPIHTYNYTSWDDSVSVTLSYTLNGASLSHTRSIPLSPAFFWILGDPSISNRLATFRRIFRSNYRVENITTELGNMRFTWFIDGQPLEGNQFSPASFGQWPSVYYTFQNGGVHQVKLIVHNTVSPSNTAEFTKTINIIPDFTTTKEILANIPNVFTPNGDGSNDFFDVHSSGTARFVLRILSRSGALIHQTESNYIHWDGKNSQGKVLPEGIYYYIIEDLTNQYESATGFVYIYTGDK